MSRVFTSTYHDTPDRRFARAGISLRRRVENGLSMWEVELPEAPGEVALSEPGGPAEPPPLVADLLRSLLRDRILVPVTTVRARRSDVDGNAVDVHDDVVVDDFVRPGATDDLGSAVVELPEQPSRPAKNAAPLAPLQAMIRRQYEEVLAHDPGTRLGQDPEAVHDFRVAVRRLRTVLRLGDVSIDGDSADRLRADLSWLARALGDVRDLDVLLAYLRREAATVGEGAAATAVVERFEEQRAAARSRLNALLSTDRYLDLLGRVERAAEAPLTTRDPRSLRKLAAAEFRKLEKTMAGLDADSTDGELHRARVRGKRARYAAELAEGRRGKHATKFIACAKAFQDVVGEHQDAVVAEERLRALIPRLDAAAAFVAGRLAERQSGRRARARAELPHAWKRLRRAGRKAWR